MPHCKAYAVCRAFHLALSDIELHVTDKSLKDTIFRDYYSDLDALTGDSGSDDGFEPDSFFDEYELFIETFGDMNQSEFRKFVIHFENNICRCIEKDLVRFLLVDNKRHCMVILKNNVEENNTRCYLCELQPDDQSKQYEKIETDRPDIELHKVRISPKIRPKRN